MKPAARVTDRHSCPAVLGGIAHVGGRVTGPGCPTVIIAGQPAARMGDLASCTGAVARIVAGSASVRIGGRPAARQGDATEHGGALIGGSATVLIGG